jgi:hypothetical protein
MRLGHGVVDDSGLACRVVEVADQEAVREDESVGGPVGVPGCGIDEGAAA